MIIRKILYIVTSLSIFFIYLNNNYKFDNLKSKEYLLRKDPLVFFAGDSRAYWQLIPEVASKYLDINNNKVVNIGRTGGHPLEVENLIRLNADKFKESVVIISVSAFLINGSAKTPYHYSMDLIARKNLLDQIILFYPNNLLTLQRYYSHIVKELVYSSNAYDNISTNGYRPLTGTIDYTRMTYENLSIDPWYNKFNSDGEKIRDIETSLIFISSACKKLVVFNGPFSEYFNTNFNGTDLYKTEIIFDSEMEKICNKNGIQYISYAKNAVFKDEYFNDWAHLNEKGSKLLTLKLLQDINLKQFLHKKSDKQIRKEVASSPYFKHLNKI